MFNQRFLATILVALNLIKCWCNYCIFASFVFLGRPLRKLRGLLGVPWREKQIFEIIQERKVLNVYEKIC